MLLQTFRIPLRSIPYIRDGLLLGLPLRNASGQVQAFDYVGSILVFRYGYLEFHLNHRDDFCSKPYKVKRKTPRQGFLGGQSSPHQREPGFLSSRGLLSFLKRKKGPNPDTTKWNQITRA